VYQLAVLNLPRQITYEFIESGTNARVSQIRFSQGVNTKKLSLRTYLPERDDEQVVIDTPLEFYTLVMTRSEFETLHDYRNRTFSPDEIDAIEAGKVKLELIPRGVGKLEVRAPSLYYEITAADSVNMEITVRNTGTRRLDNIKVTTDNPLNWRSIIRPELLKSLDPEEEATVNLTFIPPADAGIGGQEVTIKTEALSYNQRVEGDDKSVRILVQSKTPVIWTVMLILLLLGLILGLVIFGIRLSRR